jgi:hypothetical protein
MDVNARKNHHKGLGVTPAYLAAKNGNLDLFTLLHNKSAHIEGIKCSAGEN